MINTWGIGWVIANIIAWLFFFVSFYFGVVAIKRVMGKAGEWHVRKELNKLPKDRYRVFNDVMIEVEGITHQIDHIVTSETGIFVIETKHRHGLYTGSKYEKKWIGRSKKKGDFVVPNPIHQNYGHIMSLMKILNVDKSCFINLVCFTADITIKLDYNENLVAWNDLVSKILSYQDKTVVNVDNINHIIEENNITSRRLRREHVKTLKNKKLLL